MDRAEKIEKLKIKSKRKKLYQAINESIKNISINFIEIEDTIKLRDEIIAYMEMMDTECSSLIFSSDISCVDIYKSNLDVFSNLREEDIVFFHNEFLNLGAIELNLGVLIDNIDYMLCISDLFKGGCGMFLVDKNMEFGLCLWKTEYDIRLYKWNL